MSRAGVAKLVDLLHLALRNAKFDERALDAQALQRLRAHFPVDDFAQVAVSQRTAAPPDGHEDGGLLDATLEQQSAQFHRGNLAHYVLKLVDLEATIHDCGL